MKPSLLSRIMRVLIASPMRWHTAESVYRAGEFSPEERSKISPSLGATYAKGSLQRTKADPNQPSGLRAARFQYRIGDGQPPKEKRLPKAPPAPVVIHVLPFKPLRRDDAAWALANPPRRPRTA